MFATQSEQLPLSFPRITLGEIKKGLLTWAGALFRQWTGDRWSHAFLLPQRQMRALEHLAKTSSRHIFRINCKQIKQWEAAKLWEDIGFDLHTSMKCLWAMKKKEGKKVSRATQITSELPLSKTKVDKTKPNELRMSSSLSGKCPLVPCVAFPPAFPESSRSPSIHWRESVNGLHL